MAGYFIICTPYRMNNGEDANGPANHAWFTVASTKKKNPAQGGIFFYLYPLPDSDRRFTG